MHCARRPASRPACWTRRSAMRSSARRHLEDAVDLFGRSGAPFETGRARMALARVLGDLGGQTPPQTKPAARSTISCRSARSWSSRERSRCWRHWKKRSPRIIE